MVVPNFKYLVQHETNHRKKMRYLALSHFFQGLSLSQIARNLQCSRTSVTDWVNAYFNHGMKGLEEKKHTGRPPSLGPEQEQQLINYVKSNNAPKSGGRLTGYDIRDFIEEKFEVSFSVDNVYRLLHKLNFSWITSRSKHPKQSQKVQDTFKKTLLI